MPPLCHVIIEIESAVFSVNDGYSDACFMTRHHTLGWYLIKKGWNFVPNMKFILQTDVEPYCYKSQTSPYLFLFWNIGNDILLPKLFWPTVWKNCSSDREKLLKFEAEGWEFSKFLRSLEQFIQTVKGRNNFW